MNEGRFDSAAWYLDKAIAVSPADILLLEDQLYLEYLRRDFAKAIQLGKSLAQRPDASVKTFQLIGMTHKEILDYKEAKKVYELALSRFPNSGLLYTELGDLYALQKKKSEAIRTWEKGIEIDPGYSGNYYHAALHYAANRNPLWAILYAENFVNIESLSDRTTEIKGLLTELYKKISTPGYLSGGSSPFATAVAANFHKQAPVPVSNLTVEALTSLRLSFIRDWYLQHAATFPYKLFEYQDQLVKEGLFDAYNQWLFGAALNNTAYTAWVEANKEKMDAFQQFARGRVFKVPTGQYYQSR